MFTFIYGGIILLIGACLLVTPFSNGFFAWPCFVFVFIIMLAGLMKMEAAHD